MSREVRRVPPDWNHPKETKLTTRGWEDQYKPLLGGRYAETAAEWMENCLLWAAGHHPDQRGEKDLPKYFWEWEGGPPVEERYMPDWPDESRTHYQMYESTSEGTPISPVMETLEELARWLADNGANTFASMTATYEEWLTVCQVGSTPGSAVLKGGRMISSVQALHEKQGGDDDRTG